MFRGAPYIVFGCMALASAIIPTLSTDLPLSPSADAIALVGPVRCGAGVHFAGRDGHRHRFRDARRPTRDADRLSGRTGAADGAVLGVADFEVDLADHDRRDAGASRFARSIPSLAFAGVAFTMVSLAENARVPVDNPATHLELTMIHEAMILEYSGRHLALIEWAASLKLFAYSCIGLALFFPWGIAEAEAPLALLLAVAGCWSLKLASAARCSPCSRR